MIDTKKHDRLSFRIISENLNITAEQFEYFLKNYHPDIPVIKNGSNDPLSWEMDVKYLRKIFNKFNKLDRSEFEEIANYSNKNISTKDRIVEERKILYRYIDKNCKLIGKIVKFGDEKNIKLNISKTICVNNIFDYEKGIKLANHMWIPIETKNYKKFNLKENDWILFEGYPFIYNSITSTGALLFKISITNFKYIKHMSVDELKDWKDKILLERRKSRELSNK